MRMGRKKLTKRREEREDFNHETHETFTKIFPQFHRTTASRLYTRIGNATGISDYAGAISHVMTCEMETVATAPWHLNRLALDTVKFCAD